MIFVYILIALLLFGIALWAFLLMGKRDNWDAISEKVVPTFKIFQITLPEERREEGREKDLKSTLAAAEVLFNNLFSVINFNADAYFVFEIAILAGEVKFFAAVPEDTSSLFEKQITAQYPTAQVLAVEDYNIFPKSGQVAAAELKVNKDDIFPIRTFYSMEIDPLDTVLNAFSKLQEDEGAAIQIMAKPVKDNWQSKGQSKAREMQQGKKDKGGLQVGDVAKDVGKSLTGFIQTDSGPKAPEKSDEPQRLTSAQEDVVKALEDKASQHGFLTSIRVIAAGEDQARAKQHLNNILGAFAQFDAPNLNNFQLAQVKDTNRVIARYIFRYFGGITKPFILNASELATLFHFPGSHITSSNVSRLRGRQLPPPVSLPKEGLIIGKSTYRGEEKMVRILDDDRRRHFYEIGKTGTGKTSWMRNLVYQDIMAGKGVGVIDPHGDMIDWLLERIPKERVDDIIHFFPPDTERPLGLNLLEATTEAEKDLAAAEMISIFTQMFDAEYIGPMFEHYMRNAMLALMADDESGATLVEVPRMFVDDKFRADKVRKITNPTVRDFWTKEYEQSRKGQQAYDMLSYVISKIGRFISNDMMRNIIGQTKSSFNLREVMDSEKILLVNLSKGLIGEINSSLLGFILVSKLQMTALSRANVPEEQRKDFYLYIDEFQNFTTPSIATILAEARKYRLNLTVAHQFLQQLDEKILDAALGNVGSMMSFRVGAEDAEVLAKELGSEVTPTDLVNVDNYNAYLKLMIGGTTSKVFNIQTLPPMGEARPKVREALIELSRLKFGRDKRLVDMDIRQRGEIITEFTI